MNEKIIKNWLEDTSQPLPEPIKNIFVEDCLEELKKNQTRMVFNKAFKPYMFDPDIDGADYVKNVDSKKEILFYTNQQCDDNFYDCYTDTQVLITQTLLSRVDGQAVMQFLGVESKEYQDAVAAWIEAGGSQDYVCDDHGYLTAKKELTPQTLDHLLYREFTEALRIGKTFNEALEIITKIYIKEIYK